MAIDNDDYDYSVGYEDLLSKDDPERSLDFDYEDSYIWGEEEEYPIDFEDY